MAHSKRNHLFCRRSNTCILTCLQPTTAARTAATTTTTTTTTATTTITTASTRYKTAIWPSNHALLDLAPGTTSKKQPLFLAVTTYFSIGMAWSWTITNNHQYIPISDLISTSRGVCCPWSSHSKLPRFRSEGICLTINILTIHYHLRTESSEWFTVYLKSFYFVLPGTLCQRGFPPNKSP